MATLREQEILKAYEEWDSATSTVDELAEKIGINKRYIYLVLRKHNVVPKSKRQYEPVEAVDIKDIKESVDKLTSKIEDLDGSIKIMGEHVDSILRAYH